MSDIFSRNGTLSNVSRALDMVNNVPKSSDSVSKSVDLVNSLYGLGVGSKNPHSAQRLIGFVKLISGMM